jgi:hypothetical protein
MPMRLKLVAMNAMQMMQLSDVSAVSTCVSTGRATPGLEMPEYIQFEILYCKEHKSTSCTCTDKKSIGRTNELKGENESN